VLLPDVAALELRGRDARGWHETWEETRPPLLLAVSLALASGERLGVTTPLVAGVRP
jgi:hypothetical protein